MQHRPSMISRRALLATTAIVALTPQLPLAAAPVPASARPLPLDRVRLLPSLYLDSVEANRSKSFPKPRSFSRSSMRGCRRSASSSSGSRQPIPPITAVWTRAG